MNGPHTEHPSADWEKPGGEQVLFMPSSWHVEGVLQVHIKEEVQEQPVRAYRGTWSPPRRIWSFLVHTRRTQETIERAMKLSGWRVSATTQQTDAPGLAGRVETSCDAFLVERNVGCLAGHRLSSFSAGCPA